MAETAAPLTEDQFVGEVRSFIRDFPELNRLISGEESSNRMINFSLWMALDEWNSTPPLSSHRIANFPSRSILLYLTVCHLLTSVGILKSRNRFMYNDGGFSVQTEQQDELYQRWITMLRTQINPQIIRLKVALNIEGGWDAGISSEYSWISGWYAS